MNKFALAIIALSTFIASANATTAIDNPHVAEKIKGYCEKFKPQGENGKAITAAITEGKLKEKGWGNLDDVVGSLTHELGQKADSAERKEEAKALLEIAELQPGDLRRAPAGSHEKVKPFVPELTKMAGLDKK